MQSNELILKTIIPKKLELDHTKYNRGYYESGYESYEPTAIYNSLQKTCISKEITQTLSHNYAVNSSSQNSSISLNDVLHKSFNLLKKQQSCKINLPNNPSLLKQSSKNTANWSMKINSHENSKLCPIPETYLKSIRKEKRLTSNNGSQVSKRKLNWNNPVLGANDQISLPSLRDKKMKKSFHKLYSGFTFSKEMIANVNVIGQVDEKFIACLFENENYLVLIDQHAAHERVRLEKLLNQIGYYSREENTLSNQTTKLSPPLQIFLNRNDHELLCHYKTEFANIGLIFSENEIKNKNLYRIYISNIPSVFVNVCEKQLIARGSTINQELIKEFIFEQIDMIRRCGITKKVSSGVVFKTLASYACHGAIKFGDRLTKETCVRLMKELSKCDLPFQCAHGRPSIAPLFKVNMLNNLEKNAQKPNLKSLHRYFRK